MSCKIKNPSGIDLSSLGPHVQGMYDYFDQKIGFQKPPVMVFDSDPSNQSKVLGKTAYYDPQSLEVHVFVDGRHPKDMLRSIAHELIHHQQNLEGRLDVGGYMGEGYYLKNEEMKKLEQEAMLKGNALMREYEDNLKLEEKNKMSLKEWKNNELNKQLLKKFGILKEEKEITHMCALEVTHKSTGMTGHPIRHTLSESGDISHYTVEFDEVIVENIAVENLDIVQQEAHSHKRDDEKPHDKEKPIMSEDELEEAAKPDFLDLDKDGDKEEPMKDAAKDAKEKKEEVNEETQLQEMDRYNQIRAEFEAKMPNASPEEISKEVEAYMKSMFAPKAKPTRAPLSDKEKEEMNQAMQRKVNRNKYPPTSRLTRNLQESLKRIAKAKNIVLKSSKKRIK